MKLSKVDKVILGIIRREKGATTTYLIRETHKQQAQLWRRLNKMTMHNILEKIGKSPCLFQIRKDARNQLVFFYVECPKCKSTYKVHQEQLTKLCRNCNTPTGKPTRFYIFGNRIIDEVRM